MRIRRLVMLRHGQTDFNAGSRMQGQLDSALTELGRAQAVAAAEVLGKLQPLLIVSSDLRRAYDTALRLGERTGLEVRVDRRLRETHLGDWEGMTHTEIDAEAMTKQSVITSWPETSMTTTSSASLAAAALAATVAISIAS